MCFTNSIYSLFFVFWVIIPDCQLPKFTETTHKISQNCVYNVQKLFAGRGERKKEGIAPWLFRGLTPLLTWEESEVAAIDRQE